MVVTAGLRAQDVTVRRGRTELLAAATMTAAAGEIVAVVGPNGAGKSTLLSVLAGDERPAEGTCLLEGRPVTDWPLVERARRRAVLTQSPTIAFGYSVEEVIALGRVPWAGVADAAADRAAIDRAVRTTGIGDLLTRRVTTLSGGELARVALARVLAQTAPVLLLDEPTAALDLGHAALVLAVARAHADDGGTVVIVLHDLSAAARCADRVVLLDRGRVVAEDTPAAVLTADRLSAAYGVEIDLVPDPRGGPDLVVAGAVRPASPRR